MKKISFKWTLPSDATVLNGFEATLLLKGTAAAVKKHLILKEIITYLIFQLFITICIFDYLYHDIYHENDTNI